MPCMVCLKYHWVESRRWLRIHFGQVGQRRPEASASTIRDPSTWAPFDLASHAVHSSGMGRLFHHLVPRCTSQIWPWTQFSSRRKSYERHSSLRWTDYVCFFVWLSTVTVSWIYYRILFIRRIVQKWYTRQGNAEGTYFRFLSLEHSVLPLIAIYSRRKGTEGPGETTAR